MLAQAGVRYLIVLLGINDIGHPGSAAPVTDEVSAEEIEAGLAQFVARAHEKGIKVMGATLTPFEGTTIERFYSPEKEVKRQAVNRWIRTSTRLRRTRRLRRRSPGPVASCPPAPRVRRRRPSPPRATSGTRRWAARSRLGFFEDDD